MTYQELAEQAAVYAHRIMTLEHQIRDARGIITDLMDPHHNCQDAGEDMGKPCPIGEAARRFLKQTEGLSCSPSPNN